ncbi:MAG: NAD(P)-dependent alcohol dehydrogenase [Bacteroidetes bacterium]|nr:MAG: NAD(P)-dependent alcohol dehydrogenase [Bacteroidota bacterium]
MKKVIYEKYGDADVLKVTDFEINEPAEGEVLVKIMAAGINPVDYKIRSGALKFIYRAKLPRTPGGEISGIVEKTGSKQSAFKPGDKVYAMLPISVGGYSEFVNVKEDLLSLMPENISFNEAAVIPLAGLTALQALRDKGNINPGMKVLINGGSGGVGMFAIQIAKAFDTEVTAVCSGKNISFVKSFGADHVIDYEKDDFTKSENKYDIVLDAVAKSSFGKCKKILADKSAFITTIPSPPVMLRQIINPMVNKKVFGILTKPLSKDLDFLTELIAQGKLKAGIEEVYSLEEAAKAHKHIETGRVKGKLVIEMKH